MPPTSTIAENEESRVQKKCQCWSFPQSGAPEFGVGGGLEQTEPPKKSPWVQESKSASCFQ